MKSEYDYGTFNDGESYKYLETDDQSLYDISEASKSEIDYSLDHTVPFTSINTDTEPLIPKKKFASSPSTGPQKPIKDAWSSGGYNREYNASAWKGNGTLDTSDFTNYREGRNPAVLWMADTASELGDNLIEMTVTAGRVLSGKGEGKDGEEEVEARKRRLVRKGKVGVNKGEKGEEKVKPAMYMGM